MLEKEVINFEKTAIVGIVTQNQSEEKLNEYLDELEFLTFTAGGQVVKRFSQKMERPNPKTFVGTGKIEEIHLFVKENDISTLVFDDELSPSQQKNIDIPGIIEGAAEGKGLGHYFLRHIERNSTLLFLVPVDTPDIKAEYDILVNELTKYNPEMLDKERLLVISKCDMLDDELKVELKTELDVAFKDIPYMFISSVAQQGLTELKDKLWKMLND